MIPLKTALYSALAIGLLLSSASPGIAMILGMVLAMTVGNPRREYVRRWAPRLLQVSVVGLGAGMDLHLIGRVGARAFGAITVTVICAFGLALLLNLLIRADRKTGFLIGGGTAVCGGSAIAALSGPVGARPDQLAAALSTVFLLNALALFVFPPIGRLLDLSQEQFGLWSALAVHDVSSVVGAASQYGPRALEVATPVKLARTLWILPLLALADLWNRRRQAPPRSPRRNGKPWFILAFLAASALVTFFPAFSALGQIVAGGARKGLVLTLFLIGSTLTRSFLKEAGLRPLILGFLLWILISTTALFAVRLAWIYI